MDENLKCQLCPYTAPRIVRLKKHMEVKHLGLRVACDFCKFTSTETSNLKRHIQQKHENVKYSCQHCDKRFVDNRCLKNHTDFVHLNLPRTIHSCNQCGEKFLQKSALKNHTNKHLGITFPCEQCNFKTHIKSSLNFHIKIHHEEKEWFLCNLCEYKGTKKGLRVHKESKHGGKTFPCDICDYASSKNGNLKRHIRDQHNSGVFKCNTCEYSCSSKSKLEYHTKHSHSDPVFIHCPKCDYVTKRGDGLSRHERTHHEMKRFKCDKCEKLFTERRWLKIHILNKHEGVVWKCSSCSFNAASPASLRDHKKHVHKINLIKKHECSQCGKKFGKPYRLKIHMRYHTGQRPYKCKFCEKNFHEQPTKPHKLGECTKIKMDQKCKQCGFTSDNQDIQKLHALSHQISPEDIMNKLPLSIKEVSFENEDEFLLELNGFLEKSPPIKTKIACPKCGKFLQPKSLKRHERQVHEEMPHMKGFLENSSVKNSEHKPSALPYKAECEECGKKMLKAWNLERHKQSVHGDKKMCQSCFKLISSTNMKRHIQEVHNHVSNVECKECGRSFIYKSSLPRHMRHVHKSSENCDPTLK